MLTAPAVTGRTAGRTGGLGLACTPSVRRARSLRPAIAVNRLIVAGRTLLFGGLRPAPE